MEMQHSLKVKGDAREAFELALDVSRWPSIFEPCLRAQVLEETQSLQRIELVAKANDQVMAWQSSRHLDRDGMTISFEQTRKSPLVTSMKGRWSFEQRGEECELKLMHEFQIKEDVAGLVEGVTSNQDALDFMRKTVEQNSRRELAAIERQMNRLAWSHEFEVRRHLPFAREEVYSLLGDASGWPWLLPHCRAVDLHYDDGRYQEFTMVVDVRGEEERIRSVRILTDSGIEYFQPSPPPALLEHRGAWELHELADGGVEVVSWHAVQLNPEKWLGSTAHQACRQVAEAINNNSLGTIQAICDKLGGYRHEAA